MPKKTVKDDAVRLGVLEIEHVPLTAIQPNEYNPNRQSDHDFELLQRSITEDGFTQPVIVHRESGRIVDGEHRWRAAHSLGMDAIPVVYVDMTAEQMRISTLRHNRARGSEDVDMSAAVLRDLRELGALDWAQDSLMLDDTEITRLLEDIPAPEALEGEEFSEAWEPVAARTSVADVAAGSAANYDVTMTPEAAAAQREMRTQLERAETEAQRQQIRQEADLYRITVVFQGEQAALVRTVLGEDEPAVKLLELCRDAGSVD